MELAYRIKQVKPVRINGLRCNLSPTGVYNVSVTSDDRIVGHIKIVKQ